MGSLRDRIDKLSRSNAAQRCPNCRDWAPARVVYDGPEPPKDAPPQPPEICPVCGWQPVVLRIVYEDKAVAS